MGLLERFFGKTTDAERRVGAPAAVGEEKGLSLQVLFDAPLAWSAGALLEALRSVHPSLAAATFELDERTASQGTPVGLASWDQHVIQVVAFNAPMPRDIVELCVAPAHFGQDLKHRARAHRSHAILYYAGREPSRVEQYVALAVVAAALSSFGGIIVTNESARTSFPATALRVGAGEGDALKALRKLPLLILYCGFVKYDLPNRDGVWMRTYGNHLLDLPDLAMLVPGHQHGTEVFELFSTILSYLHSSGARLAPGHTMQAGPNLFIKLCAPNGEPFLESAGQVLVVERIPQNQINRPH
jgi:hypothetical protein